MKNQNNTVPAPNEKDILEAKQNRWIALSKHKVAIADWVNHPESVWYFRKVVDGKAIDINWPEYYTLHCLSRPFVPEEWGWEKRSEKVGEFFKNGNWMLFEYGDGQFKLQLLASIMLFKIPTARDYLSLAKMLGIETEVKGGGDGVV